MSKELYLMVGVPGSGKSFYAKNVLKDGSWVSRDAVRFSMVNEDEEYFSKEKEVFQEWIRQIQEKLDDTTSQRIIADATHATKKSRMKTLDALKIPAGTKVIPVWMNNTPLHLCLERNSKRKGRERVPMKVISQMYAFSSKPNLNEYEYYVIMEP